MIFSSFAVGFFVKVMASFDDTVSRIPIISTFAKTRRGKIAFSMGNFVAVVLAVFVTIWLSDFLVAISWYKYVVAGVIYVFAIISFLDIYVEKEVPTKKIMKIGFLKGHRWIQLAIIGFIVSMLTLLDDIVVFVPVFTDSNSDIWAIAGILVATLIQLFLIIVFSEQLEKFKYRKHAGAIGLVIIGTLVLLGWI